MPGEAPTVDGEDPRFTRRRRDWETTDELMPLLKAMHAMTPDHIHEELELMGPDFASYNFEWRFHAPRWRDHYLAHDQTPHYEYMKPVLQLLQWQDGQAGRATRPVGCSSVPSTSSSSRSSTPPSPMPRS